MQITATRPETIQSFSPAPVNHVANSEPAVKTHPVKTKNLSEKHHYKLDNQNQIAELLAPVLPAAKYIRKNYPTWFSWATVVLHTLGAVLPSVSIVPKSLSQKIKKTAVQFSRWVVPIAKIHNGLEAWFGNRLFEVIARISPAALIQVLPFFNFQLAYGLSSGINVTLEHIYDRIGNLKKEDGMQVNTQKVIDGFKLMLRDAVKVGVAPKEKAKLLLTLGGAASMLAGAIPVLLFARNSLNNFIARTFGSIRTFGGFLGDLSILLFSTKPTPEERNKERLVGSFFLVPTFMDLAQRWIDQSSEANEIFNHAKSALNIVGELIWTHFSTERNDQESAAKQAEHHPKSRRKHTKPHVKLDRSSPVSKTYPRVQLHRASPLYHQSV